MYKLLSILLVISLTTFGQIIDEKPFDKSDFPTNKYAIQIDSFKFKNVTVKVIQVELKDLKDRATEIYGKSCISTTLNNKQISEKITKKIDSCSRIKVYPSPNKNLFLLSEQHSSTEECKLIFIDTNGIIGQYNANVFFSPDSKLLFCVMHSSGYINLNVVDLMNNRNSIYNNDTLEYITDIYYRKGYYFATVQKKDKNESRIPILIFDFKTNGYSKSFVDKAYFRRATLLKRPCKCSK